MARRKLGDTLVGWGVITPQQLEAALEAQARDGRTVRRRLGRVLVDAGLVTDGAVAAALADMHGLQVVDLDLQIIDSIHVFDRLGNERRLLSELIEVWTDHADYYVGRRAR